MTGADLLNAYSEIVKNDLFPVLGFTSSGIDETYAMRYINLGAKRTMNDLEYEAKGTFTFTSGTYAYALADMSIYVGKVNKVRINNAFLERMTNEDNNGYYVIGDTLFFNENFATGTTVEVFGYQYPLPIVNDATAITYIPDDVLHTVPMFAVLEACNIHEVDPTQMMKLRNIEKQAGEIISRYRETYSWNTLNLRLVNGKF